MWFHFTSCDWSCYSRVCYGNVKFARHRYLTRYRQVDTYIKLLAWYQNCINFHLHDLISKLWNLQFSVRIRDSIRFLRNWPDILNLIAEDKILKKNCAHWQETVGILIQNHDRKETLFLTHFNYEARSFLSFCTLYSLYFRVLIYILLSLNK